MSDKVVDIDDLRKEGFFTRPPRGQAEGKIREIISRLVEEKSDEVVEVQWLSYPGIAKQLKKLKKTNPTFDSIGLGQKDGVPYLFIHGYYLETVNADIKAKYGVFVPASTMGAVLANLDLSEFSDSHKRALELRFGLVSRSLSDIAKVMGVTRARVAQYIEGCLTKLGFKSRWNV